MVNPFKIFFPPSYNNNNKEDSFFMQSVIQPTLPSVTTPAATTTQSIWKMIRDNMTSIKFSIAPPFISTTFQDKVDHHVAADTTINDIEPLNNPSSSLSVKKNFCFRKIIKNVDPFLYIVNQESYVNPDFCIGIITNDYTHVYYSLYVLLVAYTMVAIAFTSVKPVINENEDRSSEQQQSSVDNEQFTILKEEVEQLKEKNRELEEKILQQTLEKKLMEQKKLDKQLNLDKQELLEMICLEKGKLLQRIDDMFVIISSYNEIFNLIEEQQEVSSIMEQVVEENISGSQELIDVIY